MRQRSSRRQNFRSDRENLAATEQKFRSDREKISQRQNKNFAATEQKISQRQRFFDLLSFWRAPPNPCVLLSCVPVDLQLHNTAFDWYADFGLLFASARFASRVATGPYEAGRTAGARSASHGPFRARAMPGPSQARVVIRPMGRPPHASRWCQAYRADRQYPRRQASVPRHSSVPPPPFVSPAPIVNTPAAKRQARADRQYPRRQASTPRRASVPGPPSSSGRS